MEFAKGQKVIFNLKPDETENKRYTYGQEYIVTGVTKIMVTIFDDEYDKVAWTIETANSMFVPLDHKEHAVELKRCEQCEKTFKWDDELVSSGDNFYHKECVHVFPIAYGIQLLNGDYIGESDVEDGEMAFHLLNDGEYEENEEEEE